MPAIQNEYDDYGYIAMRRGSAKAAPRVGVSKNVKKNTVTTKRKAVATNVNPARMAATKNVNRESVRAVMRENTRNIEADNKRRRARHDLDVPNSVRNKKKAKPQEISLKKANLVNSPKQKAKVSASVAKKQSIMKNTATFLCVFSLLLLICYRSTLINELSRDLNVLEDTRDDLKTRNAQLQLDIQTQMDKLEMESYAKYQLGMQKPKESQIRRIVVQKQDTISTPVVIEEEKESFWDKLLNDVLNILD